MLIRIHKCTIDGVILKEPVPGYIGYIFGKLFDIYEPYEIANMTYHDRTTGEFYRLEIVSDE